MNTEKIKFWVEYLQEIGGGNGPEHEISQFLQDLLENRNETRVLNQAQYSYIKSSLIMDSMFAGCSAHGLYKMARIANVHTDVLVELYREYEIQERAHYGLPPGEFPKTEKIEKELNEIKQRRGCYDADGLFDLEAYKKEDAEFDEKLVKDGHRTPEDKTTAELVQELMERVRAREYLTP